jgi:hypothetical protein
VGLSFTSARGVGGDDDAPLLAALLLLQLALGPVRVAVAAANRLRQLRDADLGSML